MEVVVQALLADERGRFLLLQRPSGKWQFVGGRVEEDENWEAALRREVSEEAGITQLEIISVMALDNWTWKGVPQFAIYFYARTNSSHVQLSDDHISSCWIGADDDLDGIKFFHSSLRILLERALRSETDFQLLPLDR
jgi:8-oxo-dGTP pyrophosphatase MutT (NUDIX family)